MKGYVQESNEQAGTGKHLPKRLSITTRCA